MTSYSKSCNTKCRSYVHSRDLRKLETWWDVLLMLASRLLMWKSSKRLVRRVLNDFCMERQWDFNVEFLKSKSHFLILQNNFLISKDHFLISENNFLLWENRTNSVWYQKIIFWYKITFWYQKIIFCYQKIVRIQSDIRKSWFCKPRTYTSVLNFKWKLFISPSLCYLHVHTGAAYICVVLNHLHSKVMPS